MSALSDLLNEKRGDKSGRRISDEARSRGHNLSHQAVYDALNGKTEPEEATLVALSDVLHIPIAQLHQAAGVASDEHSPFTLPAEAARLTRKQREAILSTVSAMLDPGSKVADGTDATPEVVTGSVAGKGKVKPRQRRSTAG